MTGQTEPEVWKDIPGYEGKYQASTLGRIRSLDRIIRNGWGTHSQIKGKVLRPERSNWGYLRVAISQDGRTVRKSVHRLVALAFHKNPDALPEVNHINGNKADNRLENLEWTTTSGNQLHLRYKLQRAKGWPDKSVICLDSGKLYRSVSEAAKDTGCKTTSICRCCKGKQAQTKGFRWAYVEEGLA